MSNDFNHEEWLSFPTGKIGKGEYCSKCARFNSRDIAINAILIRLRNNKKEILLVLRAQDPDKGWWDIPGGYLDWDETLEEATSRELKEETGLVASPESFKFFNIFSNPNNKPKNQVVDIYYVSKKFSGNIKIQESEVLEAKWFDLNNLPDNVAFDHMLTIEKLRSIN